LTKDNVVLGFDVDVSPHCPIPVAEDVLDAVYGFVQKIPKFTARTMNTLENVGVSDMGAKIIIEYGNGVSSLSTSKIRTVENFGQACGRLFDLVRARKWKCDKENLCVLHAILSRDEVRNPGFFRKVSVRIDGCTYTPPESAALDKIFVEGFGALEAIENVPERAIAAFLFMARSQFFENANKRTAALAMTGMLISNGYRPLNIDRQPEEFLGRVADFYDSGDASKMFGMMNEMAKEQYPDFEPNIRYDGI